MSDTGNIIAGISLGFSAIALIYTWFQTRNQGPKIGIYGQKVDGFDYDKDNKKYWIRICAQFENFGDKATNLTVKPKLIFYNEHGEVIVDTDTLNVREQPRLREIGIPISEPVTEEFFHYLPLSVEKCKTGIIKFNASYYKKRKIGKRYKEIEFKENQDQFEFKI